MRSDSAVAALHAVVFEVTWLPDTCSLCVLQGANGESGAQGKQGSRGLKVSEGHSAVSC